MMTNDKLIAAVITGEMSLKDALTTAQNVVLNCTEVVVSKNEFVHLLGKKVFIRTVTHHYTGKLLRASERFLWLKEAAWIADDGRFAECVGKGQTKEVEPWPDGTEVAVGIGAIVDISEWKFELPRVQK